MAMTLDPLAVLNAICPQIARRAADSGLPLPIELGLLVESQKFRIEGGQQGARALADQIGRNYVRLNVADFTRLTLGQLDWQNAFIDGRAAASSPLAQEMAVLLFPEQSFWRPTLDDVFC